MVEVNVCDAAFCFLILNFDAWLREETLYDKVTVSAQSTSSF
jgi:hypothetical protein